MVRWMISLAAVFLFGTTTASLYAASINQEELDECEIEMAEDGEEELPYADEEKEPAGKDTDGTAARGIGENWPNELVATTPEDAAAAEKQAEDAKSSDSGQKQPEGQEKEKTEPMKPEDLIPPDSGRGTYKVLKHSLFLDLDNYNVKKIVTELNDDGTFAAEDLGSWLKKQDVYDISVAEEDDGNYKKLYYKSNLEHQDREEFYPTEDTAGLYFGWLVSEGETITFTDSCFEFVISVEPDGSFYTEYETSSLSEEM
ncbi:MAG: hypothetical protein HFJ04_01300 [Lachnospiraceae bacterium]|nr:hypothetical protein [Lachnospiraceae bacterium]